MDTCIDGRFERLEKALSNLIDSVTKYHPSAIQAEELKAADEHLSQGLEQVQTHQNNHLRIQRLRKTSSALDAQIRDTLTSLATTRKDIVTTHTAKFPAEPNHPVAYEELLRYARRISKTTLPPAVTINGGGGSPSPETQTPMPEPQPQSAVTPSARTPSLTQSPVANGTSQHVVSDPSTQQTLTSMNTSLPEGMSQYLNPLSGQLFFPWPPEDKIRSGSLASYQILAEQGIDPRNYDPATEEERKRKEEEERKAKEEREKAEREERERQLRVERERLRAERERQREKELEEWRRASIATGQPDAAVPARAGAGAVEKKQFQFTDFDDLDDDDDDD
ncbi:vitamin-D-receptor interacting mediator subunit 4 domain-containing protein [Hirsutella rhossiliensis]|uniref:Mediator of RNA polymerase II transcription subunit 4 n=1 Tax=Hirsutella rhossiliensis TaxID=111463 RepID=A0A9P8SMV5_9HYPO|nr:vitamin-D-receptor interacting mediator subunit 4 domain-containing protein [Hirsutella rhossiliensis]KAH0966531.1 vitamin-D-receptor interacting mediator subunit 4 domain-containing protein [Hirsutella rhossiliensis]